MSIRTCSLAGVALVALALAVSPAQAKKRKVDPQFAATLPVAPAPPPVANGAIFQAANGYAALHEGTRARRVGDSLTILLVERTVAEKEASSVTGRTGDIGLSPPAVGPLSFLSPEALKAGGNQSFNGKGTAEQSNKLSGEVSVTVAEVYPNGTMLVRGQKTVTLNRGDEYIQISGLVRPSDVDLDNRVLSTRVADARITYTGRGDVHRASRQGWLQRFFSMLSPF
jgi:flagellar L-ring protein precursor FlgH